MPTAPSPGTSSGSCRTPSRFESHKESNIISHHRITTNLFQEIPAWLQREADRNLGSAIGGSAGASGAYGGKDFRQNSKKNSAGGVFADPKAALEEEESWD